MLLTQLLMRDEQKLYNLLKISLFQYPVQQSSEESRGIRGTKKKKKLIENVNDHNQADTEGIYKCWTPKE